MFTRKPHNHASISFDSQLYEVYSFGRKKPSNPFIGGFVKEDIRNDFFRNARCVIYGLTVTAEQHEKMMEKIKMIEKKKKYYRYNLLGLFFILLNIPYNRKNAFFCSQFVASILSESGEFYWEKPTSLITPYDLLDTYKMRRIYEGNLQMYFLKKSTRIA
jgi:hypothetical protein